MTYRNVEVHPFRELRSVPGRPGVLLQRIPEGLRLGQRPRGQERYLWPAGGEVRFVVSGGPAVVTLASYGGPGVACVYHGDFQGPMHRYSEGPVRIEIAEPERLRAAKSLPRRKGSFSPSVVRLILDGRETHLVDVEGAGLRPPRPEELPRLRYLAYGTSITHGSNATSPLLSYVRQVAWRLGADAANFGVGGSAFCEPELADYLASAVPWDFATLCLSVNMYNQGVELEEYRRRVAFMATEMARRNPGKPVVCISILPYFCDLGAAPADHPGRGPLEDYRHALRDTVVRSGLPNLHFVSGPELLPDVGGLSADLLHPGDLGMIEIGERLAACLRPILRAAGLDPR